MSCRTRPSGEDPYDVLPPGWEEHRPGVTVGLNPVDRTVHDPYGGCEGFRYIPARWGTGVDELTEIQRNRLNRLLRRRGLLSTCAHDQARGVLLSELLVGEGEFPDGGPPFVRVTGGVADLRGG